MKNWTINIVLVLALGLNALGALAWEREYIWPKGKMPDFQAHQIAAMTYEVEVPGIEHDCGKVPHRKDFNPKKHQMAYLEWFDAPAADVANGSCMILISGGSYLDCCDGDLIQEWQKQLTKLGVQCVNFVYRTPRPVGLPIYQSAWEDGQRAVRMVRSEAKKRGFDTEKIGIIAMSAGSHLGLLLATSSQTPAYKAVDALDTVPCHINWAILDAPAYITTDAEEGTPAQRQGYGPDVKLISALKFDSKTCPMSLHHGGIDIYSPNGSSLVYRQLHSMKVPAELHIYPNQDHGAYGMDHSIEFMRQIGVLGKLEPEVELVKRYPDDNACASKERQDIWPQGKMPNAQEHQHTPYIEWHTPKELKTTAIQIIYSGGSYEYSTPGGFEVAPIRRYLNEKGMTVVTLNYRTPRPVGLAKHTTAWQDLQRAIRLVRSQAKERGLDPDQIGIMGSSAGGHLTLMGVTSSLHQSYEPIDDIDRLPCNVQWGIGIFPAYTLTDGIDDVNSESGTNNSNVLVPEFSFDLKTAPMLLIHGDADGHSSMGSVKIWEKMRSMGIQSELHTLALGQHGFIEKASPGTGSYAWLNLISNFLKEHVKGL